MAEQDTHFAHLVSLACHDLRTPLATVHGFARTLTRLQDMPDPAPRYLAIIEAASRQLAELLDDLGLAARVEGGRWEPTIREVDLLELAGAAVADLDAGEAALSGEGSAVRVDVDATQRALANLVRCALRHGGLARVEVLVDGAELRLEPVTPEVAPILLGEDLRDLGAAVAVLVVGALGGSVDVENEALSVRLPAAPEGDAPAAGSA